MNLRDNVDMMAWLVQVRDNIRAAPVAVIVDGVVPLCCIFMGGVCLLMASVEAYSLFPVRWYVVRHLPILEVAYQQNAPMWAAIISIVSVSAGMLIGALVLWLLCKSRGVWRPPYEGLPTDYETLLRHGLFRLIWDMLKDVGLLISACRCCIVAYVESSLWASVLGLSRVEVNLPRG